MHIEAEAASVGCLYQLGANDDTSLLLKKTLTNFAQHTIVSANTATETLAFEHRLHEIQVSIISLIGLLIIVHGVFDALLFLI